MDECRFARVLPLTTTRALRGVFDYQIAAGQSVEVGSIVRIAFAHRNLLGVVAELASETDVAPDKLAEIGEVLATSLPPDLVDLAGWMAAEYCSTPARALSLALPPGINRGLGEKRVLVASLTPAGEAALGGAEGPSTAQPGLAGAGRLSAGQRALLEALAAGGPQPCAALGTPGLRRLESRGLVAITPQASARLPARHTVSTVADTAPPLNRGQQAALVPILDAIAAGGHAELLLHGVTGSGKTEVYLSAARAALEAGRGVIILVPEIGLTPQALARFEARLGTVVAVLHSGLSDGQRHDEWMRLRRGEARVALGARSAIFAPLADVGLIVVDEEHESSYKHEGDPRYDARLLAARRAQYFGAVLLSGSATPRPESFATQTVLTMPARVDGRPLPRVEILDMRGLHHPLHPDTRLALAQARRNGQKAVVLLNRRGWSNFLTCADCGRVWKCPNCDVSLVLHRSGAVVACHHCGHREAIPRRCPDCGSVSVSRHGAGTERLEHELAQALSAGPDFPVLRLDADASGHDARAQTLERFAAAPAGILVGTQMIAKGHDFADVSLGVVLDADSTLRFPDFRAEERTFSLLTQLAGRTGRGIGPTHPGRVLVQTLSPTARPITLAARHDTDGFLAGELERRRALLYPPYSTLIRLVCSSPDPAATQPAAAELKARIEAQAGERGGNGFTVLGPAPLFLLRNRHRSQLQIKASERQEAITAVGAAVDSSVGTKRFKDIAVSVDVDPQ
jgi:primosomal protein N' (replication factor Y)